jgi:hypothetical protein
MDGCHLDHKLSLWHSDFEPGVVEILGRFSSRATTASKMRPFNLTE